MEQFNIKKVIERYNLNVEEVAEALFPRVRYKKQALDRVLKGEANIDTEQLQSLAKLAGVFPYDLFTANDWKGKSEDNCITFVKGKFKVKLNYNNVYLSLYKDNILIYQELTMPNMELSEFLTYISNLIKNFQSNE